MTSVFNFHYLDQFSSKIPDTWQLVPVVGKQPYQKNWVNKEYSRPEILAQLETGKATGIGLKLGNGLLAVDIDGESAGQLLFKLSGQNILPVTTAWTSGRPGRRQYLFFVEKKDSPRCRNLRIGTGTVGDVGKEECLEFRWLGTQSLLPPSIHPLTNKPYTWINNPFQTPPALAPEWLISLCENWHSEYAGKDEIDLVRFPARLYSHFGRQMGVWLLARRFDVSRCQNSGRSKGSGIGKFTLAVASLILKRSPGHIRKLLCAAKNSGLIRNYKQCGDWITVIYTSLENAIRLSGIDTLGPIASVSLDSLSNLNIFASEIEAQSLQRQSFYHQSREVDAQNRPLIGPSLLHSSEKLAGELGRGRRFLFCDRSFRFYGGSQMSIAKVRGLHSSTISRHLSNSYRLVASPRQNFREDLSPIVKKQLAEHVPLLHNFPVAICREEGLVNILGEWYKPHPNIYLLNHRLVSARRRRGRIHAADKQKLLSKKIEASVLKKKDNKFSLSNSPISEIEEKEKCSLR